MASVGLRVLGINLYFAIMLIWMNGAAIALGQCSQGDPDRSGVIDLADLSFFEQCMLEEGEIVLWGECRPLDFDGNGSVDLIDWGAWQDSFGLSLPSPYSLFHQYDCGNAPTDITVGDFDRDGDMDVATSNPYADEVAVLLNHGNGNLAVSAYYSIHDRPGAIVSGDIDSDEDLDLVMYTDFGSSLTVLFNDGSGGFFQQQESRLPGGISISSIDVGDLNGDERLDLVATRRSSDSVYTFLGDGGGNFSFNQIHATGRNPGRAEIGDINRDGRPDLVVANRGQDGTLGPHNISLFMNTGNGAFAGKIDYGVGRHPVAVSMGDLDNDGDVDLAVTNSGSFFLPDGNVSVLLNNGDGTFADDVTYLSAPEAASIATGDVDGDGDLDLAVTDRVNSRFSLLVNNGRGEYTEDMDVVIASGPSSIQLQDIDADGDLEAVWANEGRDNVSVFHNRCVP